VTLRRKARSGSGRALEGGAGDHRVRVRRAYAGAQGPSGPRGAPNGCTAERLVETDTLLAAWPGASRAGARAKTHGSPVSVGPVLAHPPGEPGIQGPLC